MGARRESAEIHTPATLREAIYQIVHHSPIPPKLQADRLGISESYLYNAANPNIEEFKYQARLLVPHTLITGNCVVLDYIEHALGRTSMPLPTVHLEHMDLRKGMLTIVKELGGAAASMEEALADERMTTIEARRVQATLWRVITAATAQLKRLEATPI